MRNFENGPQVLYLHDKEHENYTAALENIGITAPLSLSIFTDTHPLLNVHNNEIAKVAREADVLIVQKSLVRKKTSNALIVLRTLSLDPTKYRQVFLVDDGYMDKGSLSGAMEVAWMEANR